MKAVLAFRVVRVIISSFLSMSETHGIEGLLSDFRVLRKHKNDMGAWGVGCFEESSDRAPLIIGTQHRRRSETDFVFDSELRNTLLYKRLGKKLDSILVHSCETSNLPQSNHNNSDLSFEVLFANFCQIENHIVGPLLSQAATCFFLQSCLVYFRRWMLLNIFYC